MSRHLILAVTFWPTGASPSGWRHPNSYNGGIFDKRLLIDTARTAERGVFDYFFLGNSYASDPSQPGGILRRAFQLNGFAATSFVAANTSRLGVVATINTSFLDPYHTAQTAVSIDHLSEGRFGLNVVTGANDDPSFRNFGLDSHLDSAGRYARATEFLEIFSGLQDSWGDDWFVGDQEAGRLFNGDSARPLDYAGHHFSVRGPLNAPRPPQGQIPIVSAGTSPQSFELGARFGNIRFAPFTNLGWNQQYLADRRHDAAAAGREDHERVVVGAVFYPGETLKEARALFRKVEAGVVEEFGPARIASTFGVPVSEVKPHRRVLDVIDYSEDATYAVESNSSHAIGAAGLDISLANAFDAYGSTEITFLDLFRFLTNKSHFPAVVGDTRTVADWIEEGYETQAFDGIKFFPPFLRSPFDRFVDFVVPELQRRGIARSSYDTSTLRGHLGLDRPERSPGPYAPGRADDLISEGASS